MIPRIKFDKSNMLDGSIIIELRDHLWLNTELIVAEVAHPRGIKLIELESPTGEIREFKYCGFQKKNYHYHYKWEVFCFLSFVNNFEHLNKRKS